MFEDVWIILFCAAVVGVGVIGELLQASAKPKYIPKPKKKMADNPPPPKKEHTSPPVQQPFIPKDELALPLTDENDQGEQRAAFYRSKEQDKKLEQEKKDVANKDRILTLREEEMKVTAMQKALNRDKKTFDDRLKLYKEHDNLNK
ncbi:MAG: hypothetical protein JWQ09_3559 [Segetibacter sp.]|nr:hypothetical protein [Segetibacter sp.]